MQIETGDITPMISTPIDSRMLDSISLGNFVEQVVGCVNFESVSTAKTLKAS